MFVSSEPTIAPPGSIPAPSPFPRFVSRVDRPSQVNLFESAGLERQQASHLAEEEDERFGSHVGVGDWVGRCDLLSFLIYCFGSSPMNTVDFRPPFSKKTKLWPMGGRLTCD